MKILFSLVLLSLFYVTACSKVDFNDDAQAKAIQEAGGTVCQPGDPTCQCLPDVPDCVCKLPGMHDDNDSCSDDDSSSDDMSSDDMSSDDSSSEAHHQGSYSSFDWRRRSQPAAGPSPSPSPSASPVACVDANTNCICDSDEF